MSIEVHNDVPLFFDFYFIDLFIYNHNHNNQSFCLEEDLRRDKLNSYKNFS